MPIRQISAPELATLIKDAVPLQLLDVRTKGERAIAQITGARLLDDAEADHLMTLPRDTLLVFQCHHGIRSQSAAQYFAQHGFTNICNLAGGIEAWSRDVDPTVPRY